jgi:acyl-homoserine lactone acylase PvdQ
VRALAPLFNRGPFAFQGDSETVAQSGWTPLQPLANPGVIASLRAAIDVGNWEESRFSLPGGQSGNPLSPHYDDLLPFWQRGGGVPIAWSEDTVAKSTRHTLRLRPI